MTNVEKQRNRLIKLLKELFQLDQPDLDFGFYKIMHAKADQVTNFLENDLLSYIQDAFGEVDEAKVEESRLAYDVAFEQAKEYGAPNPEETEPVKKAKAAYDAAKETDSNEAEVYEHLYRFFERYYDNGDFMSRRYFARETESKAAAYAVPYDGREVYLHWANRDQYYIKSTEHLNNFTFDLSKAPELMGLPFKQKSLKVRLKIVDANEGEHGNIKPIDNTERYFLIHEQEPVKLESGELIIQFEYKPDNEKSGNASKWQEKRLDKAEEIIFEHLNHLQEVQDFNDALNIKISDDNKRTLLRKYLNRYTARNTMDYFIHKDLGSFLKRELDFYIKNEIIRLDDIESADAPRVESYLAKIRVLRKIAGQLIAFLAQLEDFQKRLWLKKKFVTETQYCITLDRVPEIFYPEIASNEVQRQEWVRLFAIDELDNYSIPLNTDFLKANPFLVLDTVLYNEDFKNDLIAGVQGLDDTTGGLLIHSENFQLLGFLNSKYKKTIDCIHIDPPYNTNTSGFLYKNNYKHSSWSSMMFDRINVSLPLLSENANFQCHIDENEYEKLHLLLEDNSLSNAGTVIWDKRNPMNAGAGIATQHEYIAWNTKSNRPIYNRNRAILTMISKASELIKNAGGINEKVKKDFSTWVNKNKDLSGGEKAYRYIDDEGRIYRGVSLRAPELRRDKKFHQPLLHPVTDKPCAMPPNGFSRTPETLRDMIDKGEIIFGEDETTQPQQKVFLTEDKKRQLSSVIQDAKKGKADISPMNLDFPYCHPVSLYETLIGSVSHTGMETILDFFAGSGTTGHAVMNLNFEDSGSRKYVLGEMGNYFDDVMKPRIMKVVYSKKWKDGKPVSRDGISHAFKYIRLESYEDALNNIEFQDNDKRSQVLSSNPDFKKDYMLKYWIDFETKGSPSLLNIDLFADPCSYQLKIKKPDSDEYKEKSVDLIETFNWLIGLHVDHIDTWRNYKGSFKREEDPELPKDENTKLILDGRFEEKNDGKWWFRKTEGSVYRTPGDKTDMDRVLVIWRKLTDNIEEDNLMLDEWFKKYRLSTQDSEFDLIYVNGSNNLPNLRQDNESWKVRMIEETFHQKMWDAED